MKIIESEEGWCEKIDNLEDYLNTLTEYQVKILCLRMLAAKERDSKYIIHDLRDFAKNVPKTKGEDAYDRRP